MIGKKYLIKGRDAFGNEPWEIEGFEDAIKDNTELWVIHHVLEWEYSSDELKEMNRYYNVPPSDLIWVEQSVHSQNETLHKGIRIDKKRNVSLSSKGKILSSEHKRKISESHKGKAYNKWTNESREKMSKVCKDRMVLRAEKGDEFAIELLKVYGLNYTYAEEHREKAYFKRNHRIKGRGC